MKTILLHTLTPGSRFRTFSGREGTLLYVNESRARVRYGTETQREITKKRPGLNESGEQESVTFTVTTPAKELDISPNTEVTAIL